jgi:hypothetical protein
MMTKAKESEKSHVQALDDAKAKNISIICKSRSRMYACRLMCKLLRTMSSSKCHMLSRSKLKGMLIELL